MIHHASRHRLLTAISTGAINAALISMLMVLMILVLPRAQAAPAAGSSIGNQASATYSDASLVTRTVTSNTVTTVVQQVASLSLTAGGTKTVTPGGQASYPHTLVNTGNGGDSFMLSTGNAGSMTFSSVALYADANGDGVADNATAITSSGELAAGGVFKFVVVGNAPGTAVAGNTNTLTLTAASVFTPAVTASNSDVTTVTNNAVINVTKSIDLSAGASPSGPRTVTLTYTNTGNATATALTLTDLLPSGMTYVANSARWSAGGATVLTDLNAADNQGGIVYDFGVTLAGRVTAVIASVAPGVTATLTFQVNINSGLAPGANAATANTAAFAYHDGSSQIAATNTNTVQFAVARTAALALTGATVANASQGSTASFTNLLANNGNGGDTFDITLGTSTYPAGTTFTLYQADGVTPLSDSNGNGVADSGPLAAGASYNVILKATLPAGATGGPYSVQLIATSLADPTRTATVSDTLTAITANSVDLTNTSAGVGAPGLGAGPEAGAVVTATVAPGNTTRFTLYAANGSSVADTFNLQASTDSSFAALSLPAGWSVSFKNAGGAVISNSGVINGGANSVIYADVTVPAGAAAGTTDLYFRALSPSSGAVDRLHDAVTVNTIRGLTLTPNQNGQIFPGGTVVYSHTLTNNGNVLEGDGVASSVTLATADSAPGFSAVVYWDKNNDGVLDTADPVLADLAALTGGSNGASTAAGLAPGESATLFVKVFAAGGAAIGAIDATTTTLSVSGVINGAAAPANATAVASSTVIAGQVGLIKLQALDAACDGTPDAAYAPTNLTSGAVPGACVRYQITATNVGVIDVTSVVVSDATPANTTYTVTSALASSVGTVSAPADGAAGTLQVTVGTLAPGQSAVITFGVRIAP